MLSFSKSVWGVMTEYWGLAAALVYFTVWRLEVQGEGIGRLSVR